MLLFLIVLYHIMPTVYIMTSGGGWMARAGVGAADGCGGEARGARTKAGGGRGRRAVLSQSCRVHMVGCVIN